MAIRLRLTRMGQKKRPFYRIVAAEAEARRDGRFIEILGTYNPMQDPAAVTLKEDRIKHWIQTGAKCTSTVRAIIKKNISGLVEEKESGQRSIIQARRKKRKERVAKAAA